MPIPILEGIPMWFVGSVIGTLGTPGVVLVMWFVDHRRLSRQREADKQALERQREFDKQNLDKVLAQIDLDRKERFQRRADDRRALDGILDQYEKDVTRVTRFYEANVDLVKNYEKLAGELMQVIHLNTQVQTRMVERIDNNMFCPVIRERGTRTSE